MRFDARASRRARIANGEKTSPGGEELVSLVHAPKRWAGVLAAAALVVVAACGGTTSSSSGTSFKGTRNIGLDIAITGQSALYGHAISQAVKLAVSDLNASGGVAGYKMQADVLDDATDVTKATENVRQLILQDNAAMLVGQVTSAQCQATSPISKQNKIIMMAATCNSYQLTTEPDLINPYYVSVVPNTYMEGTSAGKLVGNLSSVKNIFIVSPNYLFGRSETNAFVAELKKVAPDDRIVNPQSTWYVPYPTNPRWDSTIAAIQASNPKPDLIYSNIFAADQDNFIKQALAVDPNFFQKYPMTTLSSVDDLNALGSTYPLGMHLYMRAPFFALTNTKLTAFINHYRATYNGEYPSDWAVMDYDAVITWAKAANAAGSLDSDKVLKQLVGHTFPSLRGYNFTIRTADQQANVGETIGTTSSASGTKYPFPTLSPATNLKGDDIIMPVDLVKELQAGQCEQGGKPTTTDFALCPSWKG
jgi:branched-chain amino acid transport system substrate-binding protein